MRLELTVCLNKLTATKQISNNSKVVRRNWRANARIIAPDSKIKAKI